MAATVVFIYRTASFFQLSTDQMLACAGPKGSGKPGKQSKAAQIAQRVAGALRQHEHSQQQGADYYELT